VPLGSPPGSASRAPSGAPGTRVVSKIRCGFFDPWVFHSTVMDRGRPLGYGFQKPVDMALP